MVPIDKNPRAHWGNVVFPAYENGLEAPVSLLVFHLNCFYYITLNWAEDRQLFRLCLDLFAFPIALPTAICFQSWDRVMYMWLYEIIQRPHALIYSSASGWRPVWFCSSLWKDKLWRLEVSLLILNSIPVCVISAGVSCLLELPKLQTAHGWKRQIREDSAQGGAEADICCLSPQVRSVFCTLPPICHPQCTFT